MYNKHVFPRLSENNKQSTTMVEKNMSREKHGQRKTWAEKNTAENN